MQTLKWFLRDSWTVFWAAGYGLGAVGGATIGILAVRFAEGHWLPWQTLLEIYGLMVAAALLLSMVMIGSARLFSRAGPPTNGS